MARTRAERRRNNKIKALRKKHISDNYFTAIDSQGEIIHYYDNLNQYSKNKIHCSCPMCRRKTKASHRGISWEGSGKYDYRISERKQQEGLDLSLEDYFSTEDN